MDVWISTKHMRDLEPNWRRQLIAIIYTVYATVSQRAVYVLLDTEQ
jgi:hypothetical protein